MTNLFCAVQTCLWNTWSKVWEDHWLSERSSPWRSCREVGDSRFDCLPGMKSTALLWKERLTLPAVSFNKCFYSSSVKILMWLLQLNFPLRVFHTPLIYNKVLERFYSISAKSIYWGCILWKKVLFTKSKLLRAIYWPWVLGCKCRALELLIVCMEGTAIFKFCPASQILSLCFLIILTPVCSKCCWFAVRHLR